VLILPPGHGEALVVRRRFTARERWILGGVVSTAVALVVVVVIALASGGDRTGRGCVDVQLPSSVGAQEFYRCGAAARSLCRAVGAPGGFGGTAGAAVAAQCRKAGLPVGSGA
jgi:hypothetical protein